MFGLIALAAVAGFFLFATGKKKGTSGAGAPANGVAESPFKLVEKGQSGGDVYYDVFARKGAFGPHAEMLVLTYRETPDGQRVNMGEQGSVPEEIRAQARAQFGLLPSAGVA